ncbi:hypothetical protein AVEN_94103-1, partial [Araneus ventricosus]
MGWASETDIAGMPYHRDISPLFRTHSAEVFGPIHWRGEPPRDGIRRLLSRWQMEWKTSFLA